MEQERDHGDITGEYVKNDRIPPAELEIPKKYSKRSCHTGFDE
jgi:hypothetical protein